MITFQITQEDIDKWISHNYNEEFDPISNAIQRILGLSPKIERNKFICFNWETAKTPDQTIFFYITRGTQKILDLISDVHSRDLNSDEFFKQCVLLDKTITFNISKYLTMEEMFDK